jgi:hypothetical protein
MADMTNPGDTRPHFKTPDTTPTIYFDLAPTFGLFTGAIQIELFARTLTPHPDGLIGAEFIATAHLRCSPAAAARLRDAINEVLRMAEQPPQIGPAVATGRLN